MPLPQSVPYPDAPAKSLTVEKAPITTLCQAVSSDVRGHLPGLEDGIEVHRTHEPGIARLKLAIGLLELDLEIAKEGRYELVDLKQAA